MLCLGYGKFIVSQPCSITQPEPGVVGGLHENREGKIMGLLR